MTCPECEYNRQRAQLWRHEAYKLGGHPLDWKPELMVRPKPLTDEELIEMFGNGINGKVFREIARMTEAAHGIKGDA